MQTIDLSEMSSIKLMNRIDTKYIASSDSLVPILNMALDKYRVQSIDGVRVARYDTLYFDTPDLKMYTMHHNRKLRRQKVRTRTYVESDLSFLEVKNKTNKGRTKKKRIKIDRQTFFNFHGNAEAMEFLGERSMFPAGELVPNVATRFDRITLVNKAKTERLTIDLNLEFEHVASGTKARPSKLMIIELKQDGMCHSDMKLILRELRIHPNKISKCCIGTALTNASAKNNRFKVKLRKIEKITNEKL
ncbi:MAG: polyphosphate polymerase domain-containing protein [Rikenellaceae bacterium]|nr:polyphosphate polymerase domain-containing protein [Rikenellaceae bacterium]